MTTASNDTAEALPPKDFLVKDYELKVGYLTQHFSRMWTRFNYFVGIETALVGGKLIWGDGKLSHEGYLLEGHTQNISYLTNHFTRMSTHFNSFVAIEAALVGGKFRSQATRRVVSWQQIIVLTKATLGPAQRAREGYDRSNKSTLVNKALLKTLIDGLDLKDKQKNEYLQGRLLNCMLWWDSHTRRVADGVALPCAAPGVW